MKIAVCVSRNKFVALYKSKPSGRFFTRFKGFTLIALFCMNGNPLDKVFFSHRMFYGAHGNLYYVALNAYNRNVFFG